MDGSLIEEELTKKIIGAAIEGANLHAAD